MKKLKRCTGVLLILGLIFTLIVGLRVFAIEKAVEPKLSFKACNLSFEDSIYIMYAVQSENVDVSKIKLLCWTEAKANKDDYTVKNAQYILESDSNIKVSGVTCRLFEFSELSAKQMTDMVYARAYVEVDGQAYYSEVSKYSILKYIYNKLGHTGTATTNEELKALLNQMLEYGSAAQIYFDYHEERLANAPFSRIRTTGAILPDQFEEGLYPVGSSLTLTANANPQLPYVLWKDDQGNIVGTGETLTVSVPDINTEYVAERFSSELQIYTVTFKDYDGTVLKTQASILSGEHAVAPTNLPLRAGYTFTGWDKSFEQVTSNLTVMAQYEQVTNQYFFTYAEEDDGTLHVTLSLEGNVCFAGMDGILSIQSDGYQLQSIAVLGGEHFGCNQVSDTTVKFVYYGATDVTAPINLMQLTFTSETDGSLAFSLEDIVIFDSDIEDWPYSVAGNTYTGRS